MKNTLCKLVISQKYLSYQDAYSRMIRYFDDVQSGGAPIFWLLEHESVYTYGRSCLMAQCDKTLPAEKIQASRGGDVTYHGPGQQIMYVILPLSLVGGDVRCYVDFLEDVLLMCCQAYGVVAFRKDKTRGVFTDKGKIGAVGVRVSKGCTMHGVSLNVLPEVLEFFRYIQPCGLQEGSACLADFASSVSMKDVRATFQDVVVHRVKSLENVGDMLPKKM